MTHGSKSTIETMFKEESVEQKQARLEAKAMIEADSRLMSLAKTPERKREEEPIAANF